METAATVPVTLLAGFLGAGKTTLLNRILSGDHGERIAVVVNEFGDVGIDGRLVVRADEDLVELANGCVCCTVRGDLVRTVRDLLAKRRRRFLGTRRFDRLVVEASGLASPGPIVQTFLLEAELARATRVAGVVTLANATAIVDELERHPVAEEQVGHADLLVLNHADRADEAALARAEAALSRRNALAPLLRATRADVPLARVLAPAAEDAPRVVPDAGRHPVHEHAAATIALSARTPLDLHRLKMWLQFLAAKRDHELWRVKGILACADHPVPVVVHGVHQWLEIGPGQGRPPEESVLVLIGRGFDRAEIERGWAAVR